MEKYYCFGHQNPDTDSVCSAIALSYLKRSLGINVEERVLGDINKETKFVLNYFKVKEPKYLNDVKIRIKDIKYRKNCFIKDDNSILDLYDFLSKENTTGAPIIDNNKRFLGLITAKDILKKSFNLEDETLYTSYDNLLKTLDAVAVVRNDEEIRGTIHAISFAHETFEKNRKLTNDDILIIGDRHHIIEYAIQNKAKLIIIVGGKDFKKEHIKLAKKNKVNLIKTNMTTFETSRIIMYSNYIRKILDKETSYIIHEKDYYDDFLTMSENLQIDNYPVLDINGKCLGLLRKSEISKLNKRKVILVDHNEIDQSVPGLDEAEITEIIDHHKIGKLSTNSPINFRNMIVGSTCTIVYFLYKENNIKITKQIAGLMLSGMISDTLLFKSPTTTDTDKYVAKELNKICKLDLEKYGMSMFKAGTSLEGLSINDILNVDSKLFKDGDISFRISQMLTLNYEEILNKKEEYIEEIERQKQKQGIDHYIFAITDIINNGSYLLCDSESENLVKKAFKMKLVNGNSFANGCISRKKQLVPQIIDALEK